MPSEPITASALLQLLLQGRHLTEQQAEQVVSLLLDTCTPEQSAAVLALLHSHGESHHEITGVARSLRSMALPFLCDLNLLDTCGTGGDGMGTVNISTGAALLAAACGAKVAKHGNRSVSSACGSADVLETMGITIDLSPEASAAQVQATGFTFLFARKYHPAMKKMAAVRAAMKIRTIFNLVGPLCNPAPVRYQLLGVADPDLLDRMAESLNRLGIERALVVHGCGLDELSPVGPAFARFIEDGKIRHLTIDPADYGIARCNIEDLRGGNANTNADILQRSLHGETGPVADAIALNAGFSLFLTGIADAPATGIQMAFHALQNGNAKHTLEAIKSFKIQQVKEVVS